MKKILILSYFYPPCNLTASQRLGNFVKHLPSNDYYPIVITRQWTGEELDEYQLLSSTSESSTIKKNSSSEIHYLPYKSSLRDRLLILSEKYPFLRICSKAITILLIFFQYFTVRAIPFSNLYRYADSLLSKDSAIRTVLISVSPFESLFFGYLLKRKYPYINWVADYRDDWTTTDIHTIPFKWLAKYSEKKWSSTASAIISVSPYLTSKIEKFVEVQGFTIYNSFDEFIDYEDKKEDDVFRITYNGTLYETQPIEVFLTGVKQFVTNYPNTNIHLYFPGILIDTIQASRVRSFLFGFEHIFTMTERLPQKEVLDLQTKSDLLLMVAHRDIKGIPSSKVFEYISLKKEFIVCPTDYDVLHEIALNSSLGIILKDSSEVYSFLLARVIENNMKGTEKSISRMEDYKTSHQVKKLSDVLKNLKN